ncbi:MAG: terpene cyclase/mutase family protein [Kiritimatiellae bacterium]|nr:terpene cyclase/mutase family protein [Kiritimatiellia bacterium]
MNTEFAPFAHDHAFVEMMKCFEELSLRERLKRTLRGLNQPKSSGDYKFAVLQIQRMTGPFLAVALPMLAIILLLGVETEEQVAFRVRPVEYIEVEPPPDIQDPVKPFDDTATINDIGLDISVDVAPSPEAPGSPTPQPIATPAPPLVRILSPIVIQGLIPGSRTKEGREKGRKDNEGTPEAEEAVLRALRWLKAQQLPDGSWPGQPTAMTGLAILSFLAHGETPGDKSPEFGPAVERGLRYLVGNQNADGLFRSKDGNNYAHPIATYALCEAYSMMRTPNLKEAAEKALRHIVRGQHPNGGWDYNMRQSERDDTSYMGWCAQAVKAAHIARNLEVDNLDAVFRNAVNGFKKNANPSGGFGYTDRGRGGLSGVGVLCMQLLGAGKEPEVNDALAFLDDCAFSFPDWKRQPYSGASPVYYWYYITQARFQAGGDRWDGWNRQFQPELVKRQIVVKGAIAGPDGTLRDIGYWDSPSAGEHHGGGGAPIEAVAWNDGKEVPVKGTLGGRVQDTALCALQLMVFYRNLPTFQTPDAFAGTDIGIDDKADVRVNIVL